jgi:hypothetical protein
MAEIEPFAPTLPIQKAARLVFHSFQHSQEDFPMQEQIHQFNHHLYPETVIDTEYREKLSNICQPMLEKYLANDSHHAPALAGLYSGLAEGIRVLANGFNSPLQPIEEITHQLLSKLIVKDFSFYNRGGRKRNAPVGLENHHRFDPWKSHFRHYLLEENPAGSPEYDLMYKLLKKQWVSLNGTPGWEVDIENSTMMSFKPGPRISYVAKIWQLRHDNQPFFEVNESCKITD